MYTHTRKHVDRHTDTRTHTQHADRHAETHTHSHTHTFMHRTTQHTHTQTFRVIVNWPFLGKSINPLVPNTHYSEPRNKPFSLQNQRLEVDLKINFSSGALTIFCLFYLDQTVTLGDYGRRFWTRYVQVEGAKIVPVLKRKRFVDNFSPNEKPGRGWIHQ